MRLLIVAATDAEVAPLTPGLREGVDVLVTGVGMVATAARTADALARTPYDLALNIGVCGSFDPAIPPGTVVHVVSDRIAELGAEDGEAFLPIEDIHVPAESSFVNGAPPAIGALRALQAVCGVTVNTVHGRERTIADVVARFHPQVESMEGAGFMCACLLSGVPFAQVRAVSNMVARRDRASWRMVEAIDALARTASRIVADR